MCAEYRIRDAVSRRKAVCVSESNNKNKGWIFLLDLLLYFCSILPPCNELWQSNPAWKAIEAESILDDSNRNSLSFRKRGKRKEKEGRTNRFYERSLTRIKMKRNLSEIVKKKKKRGTIPDVSRVANNSPIKNWFDERIAMALFDLSSSRSEWLAEKLRNFRETARRVGIGNGRFRWKLGRKSSFAADGRGKWSRVCINLEERPARVLRRDGRKSNLRTRWKIVYILFRWTESYNDPISLIFKCETFTLTITSCENTFSKINKNSFIIVGNFFHN